jgi:site-specific DNA recombinase
MKICIYARESTKGNINNLEIQLKKLREFAKVQDWVIYREYIDQAATSDFIHRKAWHELMEDANKNKFRLILISSVDRISRRIPEINKVIERFKKQGIDIRLYRKRGKR